MSDGKTVSEQYADFQEFDDLLDQADEKVSTDWELEFMTDLRDRWEKFQGECFLSDAQKESLERIANK